MNTYRPFLELLILKGLLVNITRARNFRNRRVFAARSRASRTLSGAKRAWADSGALKAKTPARRWRSVGWANCCLTHTIAWDSIMSRRIGHELCSLDDSFGAEFLFRQFGAEVLFLLGDKPLVTIRINEGVCAALFPERVLFFEAEVTAVGTKENIAWQ
jgi:hypothetical protein